jgi:hypothetical protein
VPGVEFAWGEILPILMGQALIIDIQGKIGAAEAILLRASRLRRDESAYLCAGATSA